MHDQLSIIHFHSTTTADQYFISVGYRLSHKLFFFFSDGVTKMRAEQDKVLLTDDQIKTEFKKKIYVACGMYVCIGRTVITFVSPL